METNQQQFAGLSWAKDCIFAKISVVLGQFTSLESYLTSRLPFGSSAFSKEAFVAAIQSFNAGILPDHIQALATQIAARDTGLIDSTFFVKLYNHFVPPPGTSVPPKTATRGKDRVLEALAKYMSANKWTGLADFNRVSEEKGNRVINELEFRVTLDKLPTAAGLSYEDKNAFMSAFKVLDNDKQLNVDVIETSLFGFLRKAASSQLGFDGFMEEVRKSVVAGFIDVAELFRSEDRERTGSVGAGGFETVLRKIGVNLSADYMGQLFALLLGMQQDPAAHSSANLSYKTFATQLEQYSLRKRDLPPSSPHFAVIQQIRAYIKEHSTNTMQFVFQPLVGKNFDGKRFLSLKDFHDCLLKLDIVLPNARFDEFAAFLDPAHASQVDFDYFCEVLGYIQPAEVAIQRPMTGGNRPTFGSSGPIRGKEEAKTGVVGPGPSILQRPAGRKRQLNQIMAEVYRSSMQRGTNLLLAFQQSDFRKELCVPQSEFQRILSLPSSAQVSVLAEEFASSTTSGSLEYIRFCRALELTGVALRAMEEKIFPGFYRKMTAQGLNLPLSALWAEGNPRMEQKVPRTTFLEIVAAACGKVFLSEAEVSAIVERYDENRTQTVDFALLEDDFAATHSKPTSGPPQSSSASSASDIMHRMYSGMKRFCDRYKTDLGIVLTRYKVINGYMSSEEFLRAVQEMCRDALSDPEMSKAVEGLRDRNNTVHIQTLIAEYSAYLSHIEKRPADFASDERKRVLSTLAGRCLELSVDLETLMAKHDTTKSRMLPKEGVIQLLTRYLNLAGGNSGIVSGLANALIQYDTAHNGFVQYEYLINDVKQEMAERKTMRQYFSDLKRYLHARGIRILDMFRKEDTRNNRHLPRSVLAEVVARTNFRADSDMLPAIVATLPADAEGHVDYMEFENLLQNAPDAAEPIQHAPGVRPTDTKQMLSDIADAVRASGYNMGDTFSEQDYGRSGAVPMPTFIGIVQTLKLQRYDASDIMALARAYEDAKTGGVLYKPFLAQVEQFMASKAPKHVKATNIQWAHKIIEDIALAVYVRKTNCPAHFRNHGLNTLNDTIRYPGFEAGIKTLGVKVSERDLQQLARELDVLYDGSISIQELQRHVEERSADTILKYWGDIAQKIAGCARAKGINLESQFKRRDTYHKNELSAADFERELQLLLGAILDEQQYKFISSRYETRAGIVGYTRFVQDVLGQKEDAAYVGNSGTVQLVDKLRECVRSKKIKLASRLLEIGPAVAGYMNTVLLNVFPRDVLANEDYEMLISIIDEKRTGRFQLDAVCELLWTGKEEEEFRINGTANAEGLNSKVRGFCRSKRLDLEGEFIKLDRESTGFLSSEDIKSAFYGLGMTFSLRQLAALVYYQNVNVDAQWRKNYIDLSMCIFGQTTIPERLGKRGPTASAPDYRLNPMMQPPPTAPAIPSGDSAFEQHRRPPEYVGRIPALTRVQEGLLNRLYQDFSRAGINLMDQFRSADPSEVMYVSRVSFLDTFARLRVQLSPDEVKAITDLPKVTEPPDDTIIHYAEFVNLLNQVGGHVPVAGPVPMDEGESTFRPYTAASAIGTRQEDSKLAPGAQPAPEVHAREVPLDEQLLKYVVEQFDQLRQYFLSNGVDVRKEFGRYERDGWIEFSRFCQVLTKFNVELQAADVMDAFYSYLKEDKEGLISANRLYDAVIFGKRLQQYRPRPGGVSTIPQPMVRSEAGSGGIHMKRLADYIVQNKASANVFRTHAVGGRVLRREHLAAGLKEIKYEYSPAELEAIFKTIDVKGDGNGSLPHLMTILAEHLTKQEEKKLKFDSDIQDTIHLINKDLVERNISVDQLHKSMDVNGDGYVDRGEFISGMTRIGVKVPPDKLAAIFGVFDVNQTGALSINAVALYICGAKKSVDERLKSMSVEAQIELEIDELFKRLDEDKNGMLTEEELFKAMCASSHNSCTRAEAKDIMRTLDTDNSNYVDREEFRTFMLGQIRRDIISAEDEMADLRIKFVEYDLDGNGWLRSYSELLRKDYPAMRLEDLEAVIESIDVNKDGKIDIDEFISYMHSSTQILQMKKDSKQYQAVLALKHQRRFSPNDFMNYFEKISASVLYIPSFISALNAQYKNLPSEPFKLVRDASGLGYVDLRPIMGMDRKPTRMLQEIVPHMSGYIVLEGATGIPIPDPMVLKRENIVNRVVKIAFFDNKAGKFVHGSTFVSAIWTPEAEDVWSFNSASAIGTNPVAYKWTDRTNVQSIDVIFELVSSIKYAYPRYFPRIGKGPKFWMSPTAGGNFRSRNS